MLKCGQFCSNIYSKVFKCVQICSNYQLDQFNKNDPINSVNIMIDVIKIVYDQNH